MDIQIKLIEQFKSQFSHIPEQIFFAPGRVNLIGEHLDYNGGHVFPCALDIGTYAAVSTRTDRYIHCYSNNFPQAGLIKFSLNHLILEKSHTWANYSKGVIKILSEAGYPLKHGLNIFYEGNIPTGTGLSSSASLEVLTATIIKIINNYNNLDPIQISQYAQQAENKFIGVNCGIMDQFAIAVGKKEHALLLNCETLSYSHIPLRLNEYSLIIANTNKKRGLADSKYNERYQECQNALARLQQKFAIKHLCELSQEDFDSAKYLIDNPNELLRAKHAILENERTLAAVNALKNNDLLKFGQLMNQSHISLRDSYEVTGFELDKLVEAAWDHPACIGARMTGAGFGGCTVNLVKTSEATQFIETVAANYKNATGLNPEFYQVKSANGAQVL